MKKTTLIVLLTLLVVALTPAQIMAAQSDNTIVLGEANWPGIWAKNAIAEKIFTSMGYEVDNKNVSDPIIHQSLTTGDIDIHLGSWMPSMSETREEIKDDVILVQTNMDEGLYTMAVPKYVWEQGVKSYEDLNKYADKFNRKMYVGPTGWQSSENMNRAIKKDIYNLGDWEAINSSQPALMTQIKKSINEKEWICFIAWKPHSMNYILDIKYLKDPQGLWESAESWVDTLARKGFKEDHPQAYKFLEQFVVDVEDNDKWIYEIDENEKDPKKVAINWMKNNFEDVEEWLEGVKTLDGEPAAQVLKKDLGLE